LIPPLFKIEAQVVTVTEAMLKMLFVWIFLDSGKNKYGPVKHFLMEESY